MNNNRSACIVMMALLLAACSSSIAPIGGKAGADGSAGNDRLLSMVNPFVGTQSGAADFGTGGGAGNTFPGATVPFGMMQLSPDTSPSTDNFAGGYTYSDTAIKGFSLTHISGAGCAIFQDVPFLPVAHDVTAAPVGLGSAGLTSDFLMAFSHDDEAAEPGYYRVRLNPKSDAPIHVELTASVRAGMMRLQYPTSQPASLIINAGGSAMANSAATVHVDASRREISGHSSSGRFCYQDNQYTVYFVAIVDRPFKSWGVWQKQTYTEKGTDASDTAVLPINYEPIPGGPASVPGNPSGTAQAGAVLKFDPPVNDFVHVRIGISFVSVDNARENLNRELGDQSFDSIRGQARSLWSKELSKIAVSGSTEKNQRIFYTALYHSLLSPNVFSDDNGQYIGMDGQIHSTNRVTKYHNYSGWDIYRSQIPLLSMLDPDRTSDMVQSLVDDATQSGWLPKWSFANQQTDTMVGDPADLIIGGAYAFGARRFDTAAALSAMIKGATQTGVSSNPASLNNGYVERQALPLYDALGYIPKELDTPLGGISYVISSQLVWGSASTTLEYALADFGIGQFADAIGQSGGVQTIRKRAANWKSLFNASSGAIEPKSIVGIFMPGYDAAGGDGFVEGNGAQYTWFVPHDVAGLIAMMGGEQKAAQRLDGFFGQINAGPKAAYAFLGNEPTLSTPWIYAWLHQPAKTSRIVNQALTTLYDDSAKGMPGNDDLGTMSAWWVLSAMGFNPGIPGTDVLLLNAPLFTQIDLNFPSGHVAISRLGDDANSNIQSVQIAARQLGQSWLRWSDLRQAGRLQYVMGAAESSWATTPGSEPPSYP